MTPRKRPRRPARHAGVALLSAMLTVSLVATLAAAALWRQWRQVEIEAADRARQQTIWLLAGAQDWARLILREDARSGGADHLAEPWAVPLQESRLSSFLAPGQTNADGADEVFLSGRIVDQQARLNVANLVDAGKVSPAALEDFGRLFSLLGLPTQELNLLAENLRTTLSPGADPSALLLPRRAEQLTWLGLSARSLEKLAPYITLLPERSPVNLNTAPPEVLYACVAGLEMAQAQRLVAQRSLNHFRTLADASHALPGSIRPLDASRHSVTTRFFEIRGRLRFGPATVEDRTLIQRDGLEVKTLWRIRDVQGQPQAGRSTALQ